MQILVCLQKIRSISGLSGRLKAKFLVTHKCFPKKPIVFEIYVEFGAFGYQICRSLKNFAFGLMAGKFGKFGLKALFVSCAFIVHVAEAQPRSQGLFARSRGAVRWETLGRGWQKRWTMKAWMKISVDVVVTINQCSLRKLTSKAQVFKTLKFSIDFIQRS